MENEIKIGGHDEDWYQNPKMTATPEFMLTPYKSESPQPSAPSVSFIKMLEYVIDKARSYTDGQNYTTEEIIEWAQKNIQSTPSVSAEEIEKKAEEFADEHCDRENLYGWSSEKYAFEQGAKWMQEYAQAQK